MQSHSYANDLVQESTGKNRRALYEKNDSLRIDAVRKKMREYRSIITEIQKYLILCLFRNLS